MRFPEGYCWWCGTWQVLQYVDAVCGKCNEAKCGDEREANTWLPQLRGGLDTRNSARAGRTLTQLWNPGDVP
jgi:hypothetical protein